MIEKLWEGKVRSYSVFKREGAQLIFKYVSTLHLLMQFTGLKR